MIFLLCGGGIILLGYSLNVFRWARFARGIRQRSQVRGSVVTSPSLDVYEDEAEETLLSEMTSASRLLLEALERQQLLNRMASESSRQDARQRVDAAVADYMRATQRLRSVALNIQFARGASRAFESKTRYLLHN
jgi:phosphoheptose isomerase